MTTPETMEERFEQKFGVPLPIKVVLSKAELKDFIRQEITLAVQKREEELVAKVQEIEVVGVKEENKGIADMYRQIWETSFKPLVLNLLTKDS